MTFETILYEEDGPIGWLTLNRPHDGNMFTPTMCHEIRDCINDDPARDAHARARHHRRGRPVLLHRRAQGRAWRTRTLYAGMLPTLEIYESDRPAAEAGDRVGERLRGRRRPGAAGDVRSHDRQGKRGVPPGRADDGQLRCGLRHLVPGRPGRQEEGEGDVVSQSAASARARRSRSGSSTRSCPTTSCARRRARWRWRSPSAAPSRWPRSRRAFNARHGGVGGLARVSHDLLLRLYLDTDESHELGEAFGERRKPDADKFGH